jgi:hypothetical protein
VLDIGTGVGINPERLAMLAVREDVEMDSGEETGRGGVGAGSMKMGFGDGGKGRGENALPLPFNRLAMLRQGSAATTGEMGSAEKHGIEAKEDEDVMDYDLAS